MKKSFSRFITLTAITSVLFSVGLASRSSAYTAGFSAGRIIDDSVMANKSTMNAGDIQNFLNAKVATCDTNGQQNSEYGGSDLNGDGRVQRWEWAQGKYGQSTFPCLKDYTVSDGRSAAQVIYDAAQKYSINPQVILVLLQKEQSLVTDTWPLNIQYRSATGYGCPDTAACDSQYYGLVNQIDRAAKMFRAILDNVPQNQWYTPYVLGNNYIQYNPSASCGGSTVYIETRATQALYNYTPYQPNSYALGGGTSSAYPNCGAFGNLNFYSYFTDWFGPTTGNESLLSYKSHISNYGWTSSVTNNGITGFTGQSKSMQAIQIVGEVEYASYNYTDGWQPTVNNGMVSGTTGQSKPIQAIKINPTGSLASRFDLYYRTHISGIGWLGWAKNGQTAGISGSSTSNIEAIELRLVPKNSTAPSPTTDIYRNGGVVSSSPTLSLNISSHIADRGWQPTVTDGMVSGTTEQSKRIEAIKLNITNTTGISGGISYAGYLANIGWQEFKSNDQIAGTTGQERRMEAIRISLTGNLNDNYDVWYRGYVQYMGWLGWTKNGSTAGSMGAGRQLEAVETRLVPKGTTPSGLSDNGSLYNPQSVGLPDNYTLSYSTHLSYIGWVGGTGPNSTGGTTGQGRPMEALRFDTSSSLFGTLAITCSAYVKSTGWVNDIAQSATCGTTGQSKSLEAIKLSLGGEAASRYDIYYRAHVSYVGWQDWVKNGEQAGTPDSNRPIEAIVVKLVQK